MNRLRFVLFLFLSLFLVSCTTAKPIQFGGHAKYLVKDLIEHHQVEHAFVAKRNGKLITVRQPFPLNEHIILTDNVKSISIGLHIGNPTESKYEIRESYEMLYQEEKYPYSIERKLEESEAKDRVLAIKLPFESNTFYSYKISVHDESGEPLFTIGDVIYTTSD